MAASEFPRIPEPSDKNNPELAFAVVEQFSVYYLPAFSQVEFYLEEITQMLDCPYVAPYTPWKEALHELNVGLQSLREHKQISNYERFHAALEMLSFASACSFVRDICISCRIPVRQGFATRLHENIRALLHAVDALAPA